MFPSTERSVSKLGATLRDRRKDLGYSQQELAELVGLNREYISQIESGHATKQLERLVTLFHQLGFDLEAVPRSTSR